ncbi:hypothetical protein Pint_33889 [Pistacia integerrima]|uniref:Uncharacterized protein n=1 Tax=Pistacia integerrima TaxID=434235 RepID=A0ACC0X627_9ROSI|nr:hypothetical protein Pint_33889 [Pistacia integerrima]
METWFIIIISLCIAALIKAFFNLLYPNNIPRLPPGPFTFPIIGNYLLHRKSSLELQHFIRTRLQPKYGPILTLHINSNSPSIFISDPSLAHQALIQTGAVFADRPAASIIRRISSCNQHSINSAAYGPTWRLLRRNLTAEILHPLRVKSFANARKRVLLTLLDCFNYHSKSGDAFRLMDPFRSANLSLLVLMCFGDKLDQKKIKEVEDHQLRMLPRITKIVFCQKYKEFLRMHQRQCEVFMPLIEERRKFKEERVRNSKLRVMEVNDNEYVQAYVDTLFDLHLPEEKRKLNETEITTLCSEFISAGTITTSTALQWVMANLREVKEEDLPKMPYLKAVILETLRRHPPLGFVVPHAVTEDIVLNGYLIPKNASINFMVTDMGLDPKGWDDPMSFRPERFLDKAQVFDITGSREIKMMPFGVGRRICPGLGLAILHLEYFVANFIWHYEWKAVEGDEINLEEKQEILTVMKIPLQADLNPRFP